MPFCMLIMFYYHWLIKKLIWPIARQNIARWKIQPEIRERGRVREIPASAQGQDARAPPVSHGPRGNIQINRNGLI